MRDQINTSDSNWQITWTSTTTFTVQKPFDEWALAEVGNEVEILRGAGAGLLAHIVSIVESSGTYTVTLDDGFAEYQSGDVGLAVFHNWKKLVTIDYGDSNALQNFYSEDVGIEGQFLQLKVELRGVNVQIVELLVDNVFRLSSRK